MKTAVFTDVNEINIREHDKQNVSDDKILIKVDACAICTWEQRVYTGVKEVDFPFVGGHEISGHIVEIGKNVSKENWKINDKIVYGTFGACGDCHYCKLGEEQNCINFKQGRDLEGLPYTGMGGFTEYLLAEPKHLFKYKNVDYKHAALTEPVSCVVHSVESADVQLGDIVLIIGCGIMGQLHIQMAKNKGATVIASDPQDDRLEQAKKSGANYVVNPEKEDLMSVINEITDSLGVEVVFNTTPISKVAEESVRYLSPTGKQVLYSSFYPDKPIKISPDTIHKKAQNILGTANSNSQDFVKAARMLSQGTIDVSDYISEVYPFDKIEEAMDSAIKGDKYRVVVDFK